MISGVFVSWPVFAISLAFALAGNLFFLRSQKTSSIAHRVSLFLIGPALVTLVFLFADKITASIFEEHNWLRLQRTFLLSRGYPIFPDLDTGPAITSIYGPISALAYWPATWVPFFHAVSVGVICSLFFFFAPPAALLLKDRAGKTKPSALSFLALVCFVLVASLLSSLKRSALTIHADAPALGLAALACAFVYWKKAFRFEILPLFLSAFFVMAAAYSKQTAAPLLLALPVFIMWADGAKSFFKYLGALLAAAALFLIFSAVFFDLKDMFHSMVWIPGRHPMKSEGWQTVLKAVIRVLRENILLITVSLPTTWWAFSRHKKSWRAWARTYRWMVFWAVGLFMAPLALMSSLKIGGSTNTLSFVSYFTLCGTLLAFTEALRKRRNIYPRRLAETALLGYAILLLLITVPVVFYRLFTNDQKHFFVRDAYEYAQEYPGTSYFPRLTIIHLVAEGKVYHETEGLNDRLWAKLPVTKELFRAYIPENLKLIGFRGEDHRAALPLKGFDRQDKNYPKLPGFSIYTDSAEIVETTS